MTQVNPFVGAILQSTQLQRSQAAEKDRQVRRAQTLAKNVAAEDDKLEHQVESADDLKRVREEQKQDHDRRRNQPPTAFVYRDDDDEPHVDITA